ncbi:MAG TPA: hypothetical protein VGI39_19660 [Polyangiaceae bacterium]|jgi:hypothetical protein
MGARARGRSRIALLAFSLFWLIARQANANGRFPGADMLVSQPGAPSHLAARTTFGLLLSNDGGSSWGWVCEALPGYRGGGDPPIAITASGALLVATASGLRRSSDRGCHWSEPASAPQSVVDFAVSTDGSDRVVALGSTFEPYFDGGTPRYHSSLLVSSDGGATWRLRTSIDPTLQVQTVETARTDPKRIYVSGFRSAPRIGVLLVSSNDGATWVERDVPLDRAEPGLYIAAVDPADPDRVYLRTGGVDGNRLLLAERGGLSMRVIVGREPLPAFAIDPAGGAIYVGGPATGVLRGSPPTFDFEKRSDFSPTCLLDTGAALWAGSFVGRGFILSSSADRGATFVSRLETAAIHPLACDDPQFAAACADEWAALPAMLPSPRTAATDATAPSPPSPAATRRGCGCTTVGLRDRGPHAGALLLACVALASRRRPRAGRTHRGT